jgi:hypothetical protein
LSVNLHAAEPPSRSREVQELIQEAEKAAKRLELARARELWARVYALESSTMDLCQLGVFDLRLDRRASSTPSTRADLRAALRVRNERLGDALQRLAAAGSILRRGEGWSCADGPRVPVPAP